MSAHKMPSNKNHCRLSCLLCEPSTFIRYDNTYIVQSHKHERSHDKSEINPSAAKLLRLAQNSRAQLSQLVCVFCGAGTVRTYTSGFCFQLAFYQFYCTLCIYYCYYCIKFYPTYLFLLPPFRLPSRIGVTYCGSMCASVRNNACAGVRSTYLSFIVRASLLLWHVQM